MVEVDDTSDWEKSIYVLEPEEAMAATTQTPIVVQRRIPLEVEVAMPKTPFTVCRAPPPVQYDTHVVPWNYKKGKAKLEEADTKIIDMMAWFGVELGKGLGANLQGIVEPIRPVRHSITFGLGYKYTTEEWLDWQPFREGYYYPLKKPIPPLHQSFRSAGFMGGIIDELLEDMKGFSLIKEEGKGCNVVTNDEEKGDPRESDEAKINISIWTSTPSRPRRASR
ncbi:hypothetical protein R3W88_033332 [Solanum pinnatisectum]|uniref:G-patch domain-containing protein n=1 Tax=Solanum pinnatisectum TaxID=50273 RepID=A0AAV9K1Q2_9SOLN|nr:hypothetical protein R3W88_033332 [Solanum pinnatisectum]